MIGIYKITSPSGKIYIGQSINIEKRINSYKYSASIKQRKIYNSIIKYGIEYHDFTIIEECKLEELNNRERYWQEYYQTIGPNGLNCVLQKSSDKSGHISHETRLLISKSRSGIKSNYKNDKERIEKIRKSLTGKKLSAAHKKSISISNTGKKQSKETLLKKSKVMTGYKFDDNFKEKMSKIQTGGNNSFSKITLNIETGIFYETAKEAAESLGWTYNRFNHYINGRSKRRLPFIYV